MRKIAPLLLIPALLISGCANPPEKTVSYFLDAVAKGDFAAAAKYVESDFDWAEKAKDPEFNETKQLVIAIFARSSYTIGTRKITGTTATVEVTIIAPDTSLIVAKVMTETFSTALALTAMGKDTDEQMNNLYTQSFLRHVNDTSAPTIKRTLEVQLERQGRKWVVKPDDALFDALAGGISSARYK